ncbi:MAG: hypothetical protein WBP81_27545, partial [Solirubrobacteraceae bacterium]
MAAALALPAAVRVTNECANLAHCTSVPASSWLVVPGGSPAAPSTAGTVLFCPTNLPGFQLAVGSDYLQSGGGSLGKLFVTRLLLAPGAGLTTG